MGDSTNEIKSESKFEVSVVTRTVRTTQECLTVKQDTWANFDQFKSNPGAKIYKTREQIKFSKNRN